MSGATVRAAILPAPGTPLRVVELELQPPRPGEVLVRLHASGVCQDDLNVLDGTVIGRSDAYPSVSLLASVILAARAYGLSAILDDQT